MMDDQIFIEYLGGNCPVQAEGKVGDEPFYFRSRWLKWSMSIGGTDVILNPKWYYEEPWGDKEGDAGWMPQHEALAMMAKAFRFYAEQNGSKGDE